MIELDVGSVWIFRDGNIRQYLTVVYYHIVSKSDLAVFVANDGEGHCYTSNL
jgi:hypothetical protein